MFHTSDCKKYCRCSRQFWLSWKEPLPPFSPFVRMDGDLTELACRKLGVDPDMNFRGIRGDDPQRAKEALNWADWLISPRFEAADLRVKIPFLHRTEAGWDVYFLYGGHFPREEEAFGFGLSLWVLQQQSIPVSRVRLIHLNHRYVRGAQLDPQELLLISDHFYNEAGRPKRAIEEVLRQQRLEVSALLQQMRSCLDQPAPPPWRRPCCTRRNKCAYYQRCFPQEQQLEADSIMTLVSSQHKADMAAMGRLRLQDADLQQLEGTRQQFAQIRAAQQGGCYVDVLGLQSWMDSVLKEPLCFLDFEWETYAIPPYEGMRCYQPLPFQYSLHIQNEDGSLIHREYIGVHDCRREWIERLLADLPCRGSILAYNAEGAEKIRLQELAQQFPCYALQLKRIAARMVDLSFPFQSGLVYDLRMRGMYSLKALLPIADATQNYQDLDIHQGMEAVLQWRQLDLQDPQADPAAIRAHLLEYCGMDTYSMIVVLRWLKRLVREHQPAFRKQNDPVAG